jgi:hypothetical protein
MMVGQVWSGDRSRPNLAVRDDTSGLGLPDESAVQALWLALQRRNWRSLAVLAASSNVATVEMAERLARIAWWFTGQPSCVLDMRDLSLRLLEHQMRSMTAQLQGGERVFVALRSPAENPTASPIATAADAVVLCVELGMTDVKSAQETIAAIGPDKFLGAIVVSRFGAPAVGQAGAPADAR